MKKYHKPLTEGDKAVIKSFYGEESYKVIAERIGKSVGQVSSWRKKNLPPKFTVGKSVFSRKVVTMTCNEDFFSENTEDSQYWAGFIAADGCILDSTGTTKALKLDLSSKDLEHLKLFKDQVKWDGDVKVYNRNGFGSCVLLIRSDKLCEDLELMYNITPRKTYTYKPPTLSRSSFLNFLRGYIDGDGSISKLKDRGVWISSLSLTSNRKVCEWIRDESKRLLDIEFSEKCISNRSTGSDLIATIQVSGVSSRKLLSCIYNEEMCLIRKWWFSKDFCENYVDPRRTLSDEDVGDILLALSGGYSQKFLGDLYGVHQVTISEINLGKYKTKFSGQVYNNTYKRLMEGIETLPNMEEESVEEV